jgi:hypothetical protein
MATCWADSAGMAWDINFICTGATGGMAHDQTILHFGTLERQGTMGVDTAVVPKFQNGCPSTTTIEQTVVNGLGH